VERAGVLASMVSNSSLGNFKRFALRGLDQLLFYQGRGMFNSTLGVIPHVASKLVFRCARYLPVSRVLDFVQSRVFSGGEGEASTGWDRFKLMLELIVPVALGAGVGYVACRYAGNSMWTWALDFLIVSTMHGARGLIKSCTRSQMEKRLLKDLLSAIKVCVYFILDRGYFFNFQFFAHISHGFLTTFVGRNVSYFLTSNYAHRGLIRKICFIVLISPVQRIFDKPLQYSLVFMCADVIVFYLASYVLSLWREW